MFEGCTSLVKAPSEITGTSLSYWTCGRMFYGCTSLTQAPILSATTLAASCYKDMFYGCTKLTTAPVLPAETLFTDCYSGMFSGCTSLNYIKMMSTSNFGSSYTSSWATNVASTGTFVKNANAGWINTYGASAIPSGWNVITATE